MTQRAETAGPEEIREAWDSIAPGYDEHVTPTGDWVLPERALDEAGVGDGDRFLDVASGSGALSLPAARRGADVVATDIAPGMIERLETRAKREGLSNVEAHVMDAHDLDLDDDSFDVAGSQFGVMLVPDLPRALSEMVRVTRPGGQVFLTAYGPPFEVEFLDTFLEGVCAVVPGFEGPPMDPPPLPFQVADPDKLRQELVDAGLSDVRIEPTVEQLAVDSGEELWDWVLNSNPLPGQLIADLTEDQRAEVRTALDEILADRPTVDGKTVLGSRVHVGVGTIPRRDQT